MKFGFNQPVSEPPTDWTPNANSAGLTDAAFKVIRIIMEVCFIRIWPRRQDLVSAPRRAPVAADWFRRFGRNPNDTNILIQYDNAATNNGLVIHIDA